MFLALQICAYALWFPLMFLTINAIIRTGVRRYPLIFIYLAVTLLIGVTQVQAAVAYYRSGQQQGARFQQVQAAGEVTAYALLLMVVFGLIYQATAKFGARRLMRVVLTAGPLLVIAISFLINFNSKVKLGVWVRLWERDLKFCAAILDLALWMLLLVTRNRDARLLLLTGGMGVMFAGNAIGAAIGAITKSPGMYFAGSVVSNAADLASLYIWWRAFRDDGKQRKPAGAA